MINQPIRNFLISLFLFLISFVGGNFIPKFYKIINQRFDWLFSAGMIMSSIFAVLSIVGLIKRYKKRKSLTVIQIIALALSIAILGVLIFLGLFLLLLSTGFPPQD